jgi:hypothetical protein
MKYAKKFEQLALNFETIYKALTTRLNKKVKCIDSLKEAFLLCHAIGKLVNDLTSDLRGKSELILHEIPLVVFTTQQRD